MRSPTRIAAAAVIALALLLPAGYAAVEAVVKYFTISEHIEAQEPNGTAGFMAGRSVSVGGTSIATEAEARASAEEFYRLYREGKAREIQPGLWQVTLANGKLFNYQGNPEWAADMARQKSEFEEIIALQKAGKGERTLLRETEQNGRKARVYEVRYTLSSGKVVTVTETVNPDNSSGGMGGMGGGFGGIGGGTPVP